MNVAYNEEDDEWYLWHYHQLVARIQSEEHVEMFQEFIGNHYNLMEQLRESTNVLKSLMEEHPSSMPLDEVDSIGNFISESEHLLREVAIDDDSDDDE